MKLALLFITCALLGSTTASLSDDFRDIVSVIPLQQISDIAERHSKTDPEFQEVEAYMKGEEWQTMVAQVEKQDAFQILQKYLFQVGLDIQKIFDYFKHLIDQITKASLNESFISNEISSEEVNGESLRSFLDEVEAILPTQQILAVVLDKLRTSEDFQKFYSDLSRTDTYRMTERTRKLPQTQELIKKLEAMDVRVNNAIALIYGILGWPIPDDN